MQMESTPALAAEHGDTVVGVLAHGHSDAEEAR
jgi:hypothetical protein